MSARLVVAMGELAGANEIGGKAAALARLSVAGFPVPEWFALTTDAQAVSRTSSGESTVRGDELASAVGMALATIGPGPYAVRSSAIDEDGRGHSFAGQLESYLFVSADRVMERIADVWRSGFTDRVIAYRKENGLPGTPCAPAVLIQRMIDAEVAGVAFSADPVSGARGLRVVSGVFGVGTSLVSGEADADTWHVGRDGRVLERRVADKSVRHRFDPNASEGVAATPVEEASRLVPALSDSQAIEVARLAARCEAHFGAPQDIEWAMREGKLYLLQSRPVTALASRADPDGERVIWDNSNIMESYAGVTTPLTFSFARRAYEEVYRQFCFVMGVPAAKVAANGRTFRNMLGLIRGRVYYNLSNWYRALALLPGFTLNRRFMEQMMGVREPMPEDLVAGLAQAGAGERFADAWYLARMLGLLVANHLTVDARIRDFYSRLHVALKDPDPALAVMRLDELAAAYRELERRLLTRWDAPLVNDFLAMIFYGTLRKLAQRWCGDTEGSLQNDLLCGEGGMVSAEPAQRVVELARLAQAHPALVASLAEALPDRAAAAFTAYPEFDAAYQAYLARFGDRCMEELKLESATLHDDPTTLIRAIAQLAIRGPQQRDGRGIETRLRAAAEQRVAQALHSNPLKRALFNWVVANARARVRDRENLRFERTRLFGRVRRIFVDIGRRLAALGMLEDARDVFYLEIEEALGVIEGTATSLDLAEMVAVRKREFERYRLAPAPAERFETRGAVHQGNAFDAPAAAIVESGESVKGIGCCPGVVRAPVRVVTDPKNAVLQGGEILVAERTDPGWIMLFPACSGLLVERGSLLSHSAIVAREMGIPAIVSIPGVMRWVRDGEWVEMDGASGLARKIPAPPTQS